MLETEPTTIATLDIDDLALRVEFVYYQEYGTKDNQHALVSTMLLLSSHVIIIMPRNAGTCNSPSSPSNGRVYVNYHDVGGRATYSCNSGFRLVGSSTRTCLSDGSWSGSQPTCNCMFQYKLYFAQHYILNYFKPSNHRYTLSFLP